MGGGSISLRDNSYGSSIEISGDAGDIFISGTHAYVTSDLDIDGKLTASGGIDPPYILIDPHTIEEVAQRVANEVPPEKRSGMVLWYDGGSLRGYKPDTGA